MHKNILDVLEGKQLSAVVFIQDYIQFQFDGPVLSAITDPTVEIEGRIYARKTPGFCEQLIRCIAHIVTRASAEKGSAIRVELGDFAVISISLRQEDRVTAEAAIFDAGQTGGWNVW